MMERLMIGTFERWRNNGLWAVFWRQSFWWIGKDGVRTATRLAADAGHMEACAAQLRSWFSAKPVQRFHGC